VDLSDPDHERGWRRLRMIRGVGSWTIETLALTGQGRLDQIPAGDLGYIKMVGRLRSPGGRGPGGHGPGGRGPGGRGPGGRGPRPRATEDEVRELFAPYAPWAGLAGLHFLSGGGSAAALRLVA
jgi:DNA-3-methyladenine glycosylase II